jgi:hypothetical protein
VAEVRPAVEVVYSVHSSRRDVVDADFEDIVRAMEPPSDDEQPVRFHDDDDIGTWVVATTKRLR